MENRNLINQETKTAAAANPQKKSFFEKILKKAQNNHKEAEHEVLDKDVVLSIKNLTVQFKIEKEVVQAVNDVSLEIRKGKTLGLVGETGAGKTTTALAALNLVPNPPGIIVDGSIRVCGKDVLHMKPKELEKVRGYDIAMIFQDPMSSLNPVFTVGQQIAESIRIHNPGLKKEEAYEKAKEMLEVVGIDRRRASEYPHQFSGGMKQRVVIAIALACDPQVLIADEPTTALDVTIQAQVLDMMRDLKQKYGTGTIMITHDLGIVAEICDDVAVMYAGRIVEQGTLDEVFNDTRHPYTEGLFNSLPNIKNRQAKLQPIKGLMPDPSNLPVGCAFAPRCKYATDACREKQPEPRKISETHIVRCTAYDDPNFMIERSKKP